MNIGTFLPAFGNSTIEYFTPWFPKGSDNAWFTYEIIRDNLGTGDSPAFTVEAYTKNREDVGSQGTAASVTFSELGSTKVYHGYNTATLRQLVRFKISIKGGSTPPSGAQGVVYRVLPPTWYDKVV